MREHFDDGTPCWCDPITIPAGFVGEHNCVRFDGSTEVDIIVHNDIEEV